MSRLQILYLESIMKEDVLLDIIEKWFDLARDEEIEGLIDQVNDGRKFCKGAEGVRGDVGELFQKIREILGDA